VGFGPWAGTVVPLSHLSGEGRDFDILPALRGRGIPTTPLCGVSMGSCFPVDGCYLPKAEVPRREGDFENTGDKVPAPPEGTPVEELDGDLLRRGDQLVRVHDRHVPGEPVVAFNDGKRLRLIYEGFFGVSVATHEFTAGVPCAIRRGTDEVARTQPPEDQD
jgi:hypothetical protein